VHYLPIESLSLTFTASYTDPKFLDASCVGASTFNGVDCVSTDI
jgi:hypothetical protein